MAKVCLDAPNPSSHRPHSLRPTDIPLTQGQRAIKICVIVLTVILTIASMWYIDIKTDRIKAEVIYARRKARQAKLGGSGSSEFPDDVEIQVYPVRDEMTDVRLGAVSVPPAPTRNGTR